MDEKIKILMVDDEDDVMQPTVFFLESKGYEMTTCSNGTDAIKIVKETPPDILFLDLRMPVMDGIKTLRRIREFNKDLPVIIISAYLEDREKLDELNALGVSGIFQKNKNFNEALSLLETTLRTHRKLKRS